mgnify:CR=1 FL=1
MKAAIFNEFNGPLTVEEIEEPECPLDGAIIEVKACGVCRSDLHAWKGADPDVSAPHVPGHEFAGRIVETGADCQRFINGDRVTAPFILACGSCPECEDGEATVCAHQHVLGFSGWGAFAERVAVPHADFNLVELPGRIGFVEAAGMGCRISTAFRGIVDRARLRPGEILAVHGCGGVGLAAVMIGAALGARVIAIDIDERALALARRFGATDTLNASGLDNVGVGVREMTDGGAHVSIDALGITQTFQNSLLGLRKLGRHIQIGMPVNEHAAPTIPLLDVVYSRQISLMGTRGIAASRFPALLEMIVAKRIQPGKLVTDTISLEDAGEALIALEQFSNQGVTVIDKF